MADARVLIVEDEGVVASNIQYIIQNLGYTVADIAFSGEEAIEKAEGADIALMDIRLRGRMDGTDAAKEIKERFDIPIVFITALVDDKTMGKALEADPYGYLGKPFNEKDLRTTIEVSLNKHGFEKKLKASEERYRRLFQNLSVGMALHQMLYDENGRAVDYLITDVNSRFEKLTDLKKEDVVGKKATEAYGTERAPYLERYSEVVKTGEPMTFESFYAPMDKYFHITVYSDGKDFVTLFHDITERKFAEMEEMHGKLRYDLREGNVYLIRDTDPRLSVDAFRDLLRAGYKGLAISRTNLQNLKKHIDLDFQYHWLSEKKSNHSLGPKTREIELAVDNALEGSGVLIYRADYMLSKNDPEETVSFVQRLNDSAQFRDLIVILSLDTKNMSEIQRNRLSSETKNLRLRHGGGMTVGLIDILRFIYKQNKKNVKPGFKQITDRLKISRPTLKKRLKILVNRGYVEILKRGRSKAVIITERGKLLFSELKEKGA